MPDCGFRIASYFKCCCALDCVDCSRMRLCTTPCKGFNVLASQNGFMMQNLCKHGQLHLSGLKMDVINHVTSISTENRA